MKRVVLAAAVVLFAGSSANAEYVPGFCLYDHVASSKRIVVARIDLDNRVTVIESLKGDARPGDVIEVDRKELAYSRGRRENGDEQAFLFLSGTRPVLGYPGIAWILDDDEVALVPDNWGWGECWPIDYTPPTADVFRASIDVVLDDVRAVERITKMDPGPDRVAAACTLLRKPRPTLDWYVLEGPVRARGPLRRVHGYVEELAVGLYPTDHHLAPAHPGLVPAVEHAAWREQLADFMPGGARRAALCVFSWARPRPTGARGKLVACVRSAAHPRELQIASTLLIHADPAGAPALLAPELDVQRPKRSAAALDSLLRATERKQVDGSKVTKLAGSLVADLLRAEYSDDMSALAYTVVAVLAKTTSVDDLWHLLALAHTNLGCQFNALGALQARTQKKWKADDVRWHAHLTTLKALPAVKKR